MAEIIKAVSLIARQIAAGDADNGTITVPVTGTPGHCDTGNSYNGNIGTRVSAIFVILVTSLFGVYT